MALRLACVPYEGDDYLLVLDERNHVVEPEEVKVLARRRPRCPGPTRRLEFVAADESRPADRGGNAPLYIRGFDWGVDVPVELDCGGFTHTIGRVESLGFRAPGAVAGTEGWHLAGVARLYASALADLAWAAVPLGLVGICIRANMTQSGHEAWLTAVRLDYPQRVCLAGARVLASWEEA